MVLSMYLHVSGRESPAPSSGLESVARLDAPRQSVQRIDPSVANGRRCSLLGLPPSCSRGRYRGMTFFRCGNDARARIVAGADSDPAFLFDHREITGQRRSFEAEIFGQFANSQRPAQKKHDQNRELGRANSIRPKLAVERAREAAGRPTRGETKAIAAFKQALIGNHAVRVTTRNAPCQGMRAPACRYPDASLVKLRTASYSNLFILRAHGDGRNVGGTMP
jgi:hypothetical protein